MRRLLLRLSNVIRPARAEADLAREIASHLALLEDDFRRRGLSAEDARLAARRSLGGEMRAKDLHRDARSFMWLDDFVRDTRYALRTLRRTPGFTMLAVLTLALGIGATTAIFTLTNDVLLRTLPVRDPRGLVVLGDTRGSGTAVGMQGGSFTLFSYDLYSTLRDASIFDRLCAVQSSKSRLAVRRPGGSELEPAFARLVSANYFDVLGTRAAIGRLFDTNDDVASAPPVAVVSYRCWRDRLNGDPAVLGSTVTLDGVSATVVGVAAPEFYGETLEPDPPALWLPLSVERQLSRSRSIIDEAGMHWLYVIGRLRPSTTMAQAQGRVDVVLQDWLRAREGGRPTNEREARIARARVELHTGESGVTRARTEYWPALQLLLAISSTVLLIACANIANLLLARGAARERERTIRLAIGASRGRLIRQSLTESLTLALIGGACGVLLAVWGVSVLLALVFSGSEYVPFSTGPDARVLLFAFALSCIAAVVFGALPAVRGSAGVVARDDGRNRWASLIVIGQVALSLVVLAAAGALTRTLANLATQRFGFETERVFVADIDPASAGYDVERLAPLYRELRARLNAIPGVRSAALSYYSPFNGCCWGFTIDALGFERPADGERSAMLNRVSPGYFETVGTRLVRGRAIDGRDTPTSPRVSVVNEDFVRRFLSGAADPIGARFSIGDGGVAGAYEVVGVVENAKYDTPRTDVRPMAFFALLQPDPDEDGDIRRTHFIRSIEIRTVADATTVAGVARQAIAAIDPNLPVFRISPMSEEVARALGTEHLVSVLAAFFGVVALTLTCVGLYGLTAWSVERRTREIGIRIALGARRDAVIAMVIREVLRRAAIGTLVGVPAAFVALRLIAGALYGVSAADPRHSAVAALILAGCILVAGFVPARRASRIDPMDALRHE